MEAYIELKNKGRQIVWDAPSATELTPDGTVGRVSKGSAKLLYQFNKLNKASGAYKDIAMTIPYIIDIDPFTSGATNVPFEFLKPIFLHGEDEVHVMMEESVVVANRIKRPSTPTMHYETVEEYELRLAV